MKLTYFLILAFLSGGMICPGKAGAQETDTAQKKYADEKPASFRGGIDGWRRYLEANLVYPKKSSKEKHTG